MAGGAPWPGWRRRPRPWFVEHRAPKRLKGAFDDPGSDSDSDSPTIADRPPSTVRRRRRPRATHRAEPPDHPHQPMEVDAARAEPARAGHGDVGAPGDGSAARVDPDPRFDRGLLRAPDRMESLTVSITVSLYDSGYARMDNASGKRSPRYAYDRYSTDFLRCIDIGRLPPVEELPPPAECTYYNGCLVAEVLDFRDAPFHIQHEPDAPGSKAKVILRPDCFSLLCQLDEELGPHTPPPDRLGAEAILLKSVHSVLDLDSAFYPSRLAFSSVTPSDTFNLVRAPRLRTCTLPRRPPARTVSQTIPALTLALLGGASRQVRENRKVQLQRAIPPPSTEPALPYGMILDDTKNPKLATFPEKFLRQPSTAPPEEHQLQTLRMLRLAQSPREETKATGGTAKHQPYCGLDIVRTPGKGCDCVIRRCTFVDRATPDPVDYARVHMGSRDRATRFADQFRRLAKLEGYMTTQDSAHPVARLPQRSTAPSTTMAATSSQVSQMAGQQPRQQPVPSNVRPPNGQGSIPANAAAWEQARVANEQIGQGLMGQAPTASQVHHANASVDAGQLAVSQRQAVARNIAWAVPTANGVAPPAGGTHLAHSMMPNPRPG